MEKDLCKLTFFRHFMVSAVLISGPKRISRITDLSLLILTTLNEIRRFFDGQRTGPR